MAWYPLAKKYHGPSTKTGYDGLVTNLKQGVVCHSMVGPYSAALGELDNTFRRASWHFSVLKSGEVIQHYDTDAITWHCGSLYYNMRLIGIEHEGGLSPYNEPLTEAQRNASVALVKWLSETHGFALKREGVNAKTLFEHKEIAPPDDATACPSFRIPWSFYTGGRMYTDAQIDAKVGALFANAIQNGADILKNRALINALAGAFFDHVQNHASTAVDVSRAEFERVINEIRTAQDDLERRINAAADELGG